MKYSSDIRILALDPATQMGWAFLADGILTSGTIKFSRKKGRKHLPDDHEGKPVLDFHRWLRSIISADRPDVIIYEDVLFHTSAYNSRLWAAWRAIILLNTASCNLRLETFHIGTIKKFATGKGNADKDLMIASAQANYTDQEIKDDNQADALHILHLYLSTL